MSRFFTVAFALFIVFTQVTLAQDAVTTNIVSATSTSEAIVLARVNVQNCLIDQKGDSVIIDCDFINNGSIQSGIKYAIVLLSGEGKEQTVVDQLVYDETLTLKEGETLHKTISYPVPPYVNGTVEVWIKASNSDGLPLAQNKVGLSSHTKRGDTALIDTSSCYITIVGDTTNTKYTPVQGVDIKPTEELLGHCTVLNQGTKQLTLTPNFATHYRTVFGPVVETNIINNEPLILEAGLSAEYTFALPRPQVPQAYDTVVNLYSNDQPVTNKATFHYVIQGASATIQTLTLDKTSYTTGETAVVTAAWTGSADGFPGSRLGGTKSAAQNINVTIMSGDTLCGQLSQAADEAKGMSFTANVPVTADCPYPQVTVQVQGVDNQVLTERTLTTAMPPEVSTTTDNSNQPPWVYRLLIGVIVLLLAAVCIALYRKHQDKKDDGMKMTTPMSLLFFLMVGLSVLGTPGVVGADSVLLPDGSTLVLSLNKSAYAPSETIAANGGSATNIIQPYCSNMIGDFIWDVTTVVTNLPTGEAYTYSPTNGYAAQQTHNFSGVATPGPYTMRFVVRMFGAVGDYTNTYNIPYTVVGPPAPTASLTASPSTIIAGGATDLTAACTNSTSASINNGAPGIGASGGTVSVSPSNTTTYTLTCTGSGSAQSQTTVTVNPAVPSTPTGLSASPSSCGTGQVNVSWSAVSGATSYDLRNSAGTVIYSGAGTSFSHTGLAAGSAQSYTVRATNSAGSSAYSGSVSATTPSACASAPTVPTGLSASPAACGTGQVNISWGSVSGATSYQLRNSAGTVIYSGAGTSFSHTGLGASSAQSYTVQATNAAGSSGYSSAVNTNAPAVCASAPTVPTGLSASPAACGTGQVNVSWNAASGATSYQLKNSAGTVIYSGGATSFAHTGLAVGSAQSYTVQATNAAGSSGYSGSVGATAPIACASVPATPTGLSATPAACGTGQINVAWNAAATASGYDLSVDGGVWNNQGNVLSYNHTSLAAGSAHSYSVRAWNVAGAGTASVVLNVNAPSACAAPPPPSATITATPQTCNIPIGGSACGVNVSWTSSNTTAPRTITRTGNPLLNNVNASDSTSQTLAPGNYLYAITHNGGTKLAEVAVAVDCINGSSWNDTTSTCTVDPADPNINLTITPAQLVRHGATAYVSWETTEYAGLSCRVVGPGIDSIEFDKTNEPTPPVTAKMLYTLTCTALGARWTDTATVESVGEIEEI